MDNNKTILENIKNRISQIEEIVDDLNVINIERLYSIENQVKEIKRDIIQISLTDYNDKELLDLVERVCYINEDIDEKIKQDESKEFNILWNQITKKLDYREQLDSNTSSNNGDYNKDITIDNSCMQFIEEWKRYAESRSYGIIRNNNIDQDNNAKQEPYRFISYFIIFNFLYNQVETKNKYLTYKDILSSYKRKPNSSLTEREQVEIYTRFLMMNGYNPFERDKIKELFKPGKAYYSEYCRKYVSSKRNGNLQYDRNNNVNLALIRECKTEGIVPLIQCVYTVRCNLFHGAKCIEGLEHERNRNLVKEGSDILKDLIEFIQCKSLYTFNEREFLEKYKKHTR